MYEIFGRKVSCYTIALSEEHPDYSFAKQVVDQLKIEWHFFVVDQDALYGEENDCSGDAIVRQFYQQLNLLRVNQILACDGIDEYMGGYYDHLHKPTLETYYLYLGELMNKHLVPLHENSRDIRVFLPYLDPRLVTIYNNYEMCKRFDNDGRKKVIVNLARNMRVPEEIINRRKYGFCDAAKIKE